MRPQPAGATDWQTPSEIQQRKIPSPVLGKDTPMYPLGRSYGESSSVEKDLVVQPYSKPNRSQPWVLLAGRTRSLQGCSRLRIAHRTRGVIVPLYPTLMGPIRNAGSNAGLPGARKILIKWRKSREGLQDKDYKMFKTLGCHLVMLRDLGLFSLERVQGALAWKTDWGSEEDWVRFLSVLPCDRTRDHLH